MSIMLIATRIMITAAAGAAALAGSIALAAPAMAGNGPASVTAVTHSFMHNDTTGFAVYTGDTVWAHDNLMERFVATDNGNGTWTVAITVNGSFDGFADPRTQLEEDQYNLQSEPGSPLDSHGSVKGTYTVTVTSALPPDPKALPAQEPDGTGLGAAIHQLFPGDDATEAIAGGPHSFTYTKGTARSPAGGLIPR
jgi:hypothetical protein